MASSSGVNRSGPDGTLRPSSEWMWKKGFDSHWAISTTVRCQHRCLYCYEGERRGQQDVPLEQTKALLDRAAKEVPMVMFLGAEPTMNPHLPELIHYGVSRGLRVGLSTNALRLADWAFLTTLDKAGLDFVEFSFSYPDALTYTRVTRHKPEGFRRLLKALDNMARWQRDLAANRQGGLFANAVVSGFNVDRLDEILGRLTAHLNPGRFVFNLLRLDVAPQAHDASLRRYMQVSCAKLRQALPAFAARAGGVPLCFSNFPLCAMPGLESSSNELCYRLNGVDVKQNFFNQGQMDPLPLGDLEKTSRSFDWICESCALSSLCTCRGLFDHADASPEHAPQPLRGALPRALGAWVRRQEGGRSVLAAETPLTESGWVLARLRAACPTDRLLAKSSARWAPLERGMIGLYDGERTAHLRLRRDDGARGHWRLEPAVPAQTPAWARAAAAALAAVLRRLPAPPMRCLPDPTPRDSSKTTGPQARPEAPPPLEDPAFPSPVTARWARFVSGPFLEQVRRAALREPALAGGRADIVRPGAIRLSGPAGPDCGEVVVRPASGPKSLGVICGPLRLQMTWLGEGGGAEAWLRAFLAASSRLGDASLPPEARRIDAFLARVWKLYGGVLLPRMLAHGGLSGGWVSDDGLELEMLRTRGQSFGITLGRAERMERPYASGDGIGLRYVLPEGLPDKTRWMAVIEAYARRLATKC